MAAPRDPDDQIVVFGPYGRKLTRRDDRALTIVAKHVAASLLERHIGDAWEDYPEVSERDWDDIVERVAVFAAATMRLPEDDLFTTAYAHLQARAESGEAS